MKKVLVQKEVVLGEVKEVKELPMTGEVAVLFEDGRKQFVPEKDFGKFEVREIDDSPKCTWEEFEALAPDKALETPLAHVSPADEGQKGEIND